MKKIVAILIAAILAISATAFAATYVYDDITFDYDENFFTITTDDHTDDEDLVILTDKNGGFVRIHLRDMEDGETFPTAESIAQTVGVEVIAMDEWANFKNVLCYDLTGEDSYYESVFIAPVYDDDENEIDDILTINIGGPTIADEDAAIESSDLTSEVVDTLRVVED